jgi:Na+-translocating ferredoxin:NAD+ oxidoreductase RnfD subunit
VNARFFKTPKGLLTIILPVLLAIAVPIEGISQTSSLLASAIGVAALIDAVILRVRRGAWEYPSGAVLTGMIVAMVLSPHEPLYVAAIASSIGVLSKYVVRTRTANVFNPAALGLVIVAHWFGAGESWWGALPDAAAFWWIVLAATGIFIADRVNKMPFVLAFAGVYYLAFTLTAFVGDPRQVAEVYRTPDVQALMYFSFFILTDPPTSPVKFRPQIVCGTAVALVSYGFFEVVGGADYLLVGVLAGNLISPLFLLRSAREPWRPRPFRTAER